LGVLVKRCLVKTSMIACCAVMATHAFAQSSAQPRNAAAASGKAPADAPKTQTAAASAKAAKPTVAAAAAVTAAGSVIVLADGIVANAALAQFQPPADGFVYER
jgi:hypothetical protein